MHVTDSDLIKQIEATCPPPVLALTTFSKDIIDDPHVSDATLMQENIDDVLSPINQFNQRAFYDFDYALGQWDQAGRKGPLPHMPHTTWPQSFGSDHTPARSMQGYLGFSLDAYKKYWALDADGKDAAGQSSFITDLGAIPYPVIESAPLPPPLDFTSLVGPPLGPGYFFGTLASKAFSNGYGMPSTLSPTGWLTHMVAVEPMMTFDYWIVTLPPAIAAPVIPAPTLVAQP